MAALPARLSIRFVREGIRIHCGNYRIICIRVALILTNGKKSQPLASDSNFHHFNRKNAISQKSDRHS